MKRYIIIAGALVALVSCAKVENFVSAGASSGDEIGFTSYMGRTITKSDGSSFTQSFNVESFLSGNPATRFFVASPYRYINGRFIGDTTRYWPSTGENLDFYATSPLTYTNTSGASVRFKSDDSTFTVTATDGKTDIVASRLVNVAKTTPVNLTFGHKLTRVVFKAIGADTTKTYKIDSLTLTANSSAVYSFGPTESWGESSDAYTYTVLGTDLTIPAKTGAAQAVGEPLYLIPRQGVTVKARIRYSIYEGGYQIDTTTNAVELELPAEDLWGINKSVVYKLRLNFTSSAAPITFTSEAVEWWLDGSWDDEQNIVVPAPEYIDNGINFGKGILVGGRYWAPVNCGTDTAAATQHLYGLLYQFGRPVGSGYVAADDPSTADVDESQWNDEGGLIQQTLATTFVYHINSKLSSSDFNDWFYTNTSGYSDWLSDTLAFTVENRHWYNKYDGMGYFPGVLDDPCPDGWRVPTLAEMDKLIGGDGSGSSSITGMPSFVIKDGMNGHWFNGTNTPDKLKEGSSTEYEGVFLPAGGGRRGGTGSTAGVSYNRTNGAAYWSSSSYYDSWTCLGWHFAFDKTNSWFDYNSRTNGFYVRCIYN